MSLPKPWMQFHTRDWLDNKELRRCSPIARSVLTDLMCLAHEGEPVGYLADKLGALEDTYMASRCVLTVPKFKAAVSELIEHGRLSRTDGGLLCIPRMVRDAEISAIRRESGVKGGNPDLLKQSGLPNSLEVGLPPSRVGGGVRSDSPTLVSGEVFSEKKKNQESADFDSIWRLAEFDDENQFRVWFEQFYRKHRRPGQIGVAENYCRVAILEGRMRRSQLEENYALHRASRAWTEEGGKYIPKLSVFFTDRMWEIPPCELPLDAKHGESLADRIARL